LRTLFRRAQSYYSKQQPDKMVGDFRDVLKLMPNAPEAPRSSSSLADLEALVMGHWAIDELLRSRSRANRALVVWIGSAVAGGSPRPVRAVVRDPGRELALRRRLARSWQLEHASFLVSSPQEAC
jgi:hypothetical protein